MVNVSNFLANQHSENINSTPDEFFLCASPSLNVINLDYLFLQHGELCLVSQIKNNHLTTLNLMFLIIELYWCSCLNEMTLWMILKMQQCILIWSYIGRARGGLLIYYCQHWVFCLLRILPYRGPHKFTIYFTMSSSIHALVCVLISVKMLIYMYINVVRCIVDQEVFRWYISHW